MGVLTRNHFGIIAFIEKILHLLNVKVVCQLNALLAVILLHFENDRMFYFSSFLLVCEGLGLSLVSIGLQLLSSDDNG
jgi:hypothetical protein